MESQFAATSGGAAFVKLRIGCGLPYVRERQTHSSGPKRKRDSHHRLSTTSNPNSNAAHTIPSAGRSLSLSPYPETR